MVWYALNNCIQVEKYVKYALFTLLSSVTNLCIVNMLYSNGVAIYLCRMFRDELEREGVPNVERLLRQGFETWFRNHVSFH